jgi:hypothetical protein
VVFGSGTDAGAQTKIPQMTVVIYNNSTDFNIYPLISFPGVGPRDSWLQGFFKVTSADIDTKKYSSALTRDGNPAVTRMYVNCCAPGEKGIPPRGSVRIKLPLYSPLVTTIDPAKPNQLIEWWQSGNINFYQSPKAEGPPPALRDLWRDATRQRSPIVSGHPRCVDDATCSIRMFSVTTGNPLPAEPQQLVEFTLGAAPANPNRGNAGEPFYLFDPQNVDYDVSYVNTAYLPVVMEPFGNNLVGWVGTANSIDSFNKAVVDFLNSRGLGKGWPLFIGKNGRVVRDKIPSALEILASSVANEPGDPDKDGQWVVPPKFKPAPADSAPIKRLINLWQRCTNGTNAAPICAYINEATALLRANFNNYIANYKLNPPGWNCDQTKQPHPPSAKRLTDLQLLQHLYSWIQFNEHCDPEANLLQTTPGYAQKYEEIKNGFDHLQYWKDVLEGDYGAFHPYVALIHGPTYLNAPYTYAYSVDDAVGNMQTYGTGLIIAVGGKQRLPNPDHATPDVHFNYAYKSLSNGNFFTKYGRCEPTADTDTNPNFSSFAVPVGVTKKVSDCLITFLDNLDRKYQFQISDEHPPETWPWFYDGINQRDPAAHEPVAHSCIKNTEPMRTEWCDFIFVFRKRLNDARSTIEYHVQIREPPPR